MKLRLESRKIRLILQRQFFPGLVNYPPFISVSTVDLQKTYKTYQRRSKIYDPDMGQG